MNDKTRKLNIGSGNHIPEFESSGNSPGFAQAEKKKRGRPRKYANNAAKTAAYRLREQKRRKDAERSEIVAWLIGRCKAMSPSPSKGISESVADTIRAETTRYLGTFEDHLIGLSIDDLQQLKNVWEQTPDSHGRLHNERSGETEQTMGLSEIERLAAQRYSKFFGGRKVWPIGRGPDSYDGMDATLLESTCVTRSKMVCCVPDCGSLGAVIHPEDCFKRLAEVRVLCDRHRNFVTQRPIGIS